MVRVGTQTCLHCHSSQISAKTHVTMSIVKPTWPVSIGRTVESHFRLDRDIRHLIYSQSTPKSKEGILSSSTSEVRFLSLPPDNAPRSADLGPWLTNLRSTSLCGRP